MVLVLALAFSATAPAVAAARSPLVRVVADVRSHGPRIPRSFLGFSQEYNIVPSQVGDHLTGLNPVIVGLWDNFTRLGGGPPTLRVGGGSTDGSTWNPEGKPKPPGIDFGISYPWVIGVNHFVTATHAPLILGLNMALNDPKVAVDWANNARLALPKGSIRAFEVGNEPDYFIHRPFGVDASGRKRYARPRSYGVGSYLRELARFDAALERLRPRPTLAGPSLCCDPKWTAAFPRILGKEHRHLRLATVHGYPLAACGAKPGHRGYPTAAALLRPATVIGKAASFIPLVRAARHVHLPLRVTETNSAACGGAKGASDVFASALWGADWAFSLAVLGANGADFHSGATLYQPFATGLSDGQWTGYARPLYYGLLLFAQATPHNARLLPSTYYGARPQPGANLRVFGAVDRHDKVVRVVVINKDLHAHGSAVVRVPGARGSGKVRRLLAPSVRSTRGITLAGQQVASPSLDGSLVGPEVATAVRRRAHSTYRFEVPAGSAAMLTVPVSRTR